MIQSEEVVVVLLHKNFENYLLQLRDFSPTIIRPGHWGCFGGGIEHDESVLDSARRELAEEIRYCPDYIYEFGSSYEDGQMIRVCHAELKVPLSRLQQCEGIDMGLFTSEEILTEKLFSSKLKKNFPVSPPLVGIIKNYLDNLNFIKR